MKSLDRLVILAGACVLMQACATPHPANTVAAATPANIPAATSGTAPAAAGVTDPAHPNRIVLHDESLTNSEIKDLFAQGYKPVSRRGMVLYCRNETLTGSRFPTMICKTGSEMKQLTQDSKDMLGAQRARTGQCSQKGC